MDRLNATGLRARVKELEERGQILQRDFDRASRHATEMEFAANAAQELLDDEVDRRELAEKYEAIWRERCLTMAATQNLEDTNGR